jgi:hypothetical protein
MKSGNLNLLEPSGPLQACNGTAVYTGLKLYCGAFGNNKGLSDFFKVVESWKSVRVHATFTKMIVRKKKITSTIPRKDYYLYKNYSTFFPASL